MNYPTEVKEAAKRLYLRRCSVKEIQAHLKLPNIRIVYYWIRQGCWDEMLTDEEPLSAISRRITLILEKVDTLTKGELDELERLTTLRERLIKQSSKPAPAAQSDSPDEPRDRPSGQRRDRSDGGGKKREKKVKNDISGLTEVDFLDKFISKMYGYQKELFEAKQNPLTRRVRNILKSRQVGLTYYFAGEAFMDAVLSGDNQVFLSASRSQSEIFRSYIIQFAQQWFGIELTGNPITLSNGAELRFLSTNSSTAQGYHGHVYVDEYFWIRDFEKLSTVASAMGTHKKWRKTYFSTPSAVSHQAYPFWSGEEFRNSKRGKKAGGVWPTEAAYTQGALCPDGQWRKTITLDDAIAGGCNLFDLEQLQLEYDEDKFQQLFYCKFIDSTQSAFSLKDLERCYSDLSLWEDYNPELDRPFGNSPVWLGYDPSRTRDDSTCVVIAPPLEPGAKFRILEKHSWRGHSFTHQAAQVKKLTERFNVQHIGIDVTGVGHGVFDLVRDFYAKATPIHYSLEAKNTLVLKAQDTIQGSRIEWDAGWTDIAQAFLTIKRGATTSGQITYSASRTDATGHADIAWAIMHALANEPLNTNKRRRSRYVTSTHSSHGQQTQKTTASSKTTAANAVLYVRGARASTVRQHWRVRGGVSQRRRQDLQAAGVACRPGQAVARQRAPRRHSQVQTQPATA
ncbi:terminase large subunit domain-containing protein [Pseudomonas nunensis]|uniref:Terminase family protein n=1 Tax=Pseudomonas nunensis TaxID=2961896 RepID=A0ABY5EC57_9PSED|nr:terminase family protein [Pseudomonas nunensis]KPN91714.1 terminase [Pseudomonas nunensis]MCL5229590.1 terminase family protein [Pseudomonas nunensis]UTO11917.1 terminase family protein [Pseudomonas nunensis]